MSTTITTIVELNIPGLYIIYDAIGIEAERELISQIDSSTWNTSLSRRTQHYGYEYNYNSKKLKPAPSMSGTILQLANHLTQNKYMNQIDQAIINEYKRDQHISSHTDANMFGPVIISVSLLEDCNFIFSNTKLNQNFQYLVPRYSALILTGEARSQWKHEIPKLKTLLYGDKKVPKSETYRRVSVTFRSVL